MAQVKYLEYKKEKIPYRVKYNALKEWQKETGKTLADLDKLDSDMQILESLFWHSVVSGYQITGRENPYNSREEMGHILDECWLTFIKGVPSFFQ